MVVCSMRKDSPRAAHTLLLSWREDSALSRSLSLQNTTQASLYTPCCASNIGEPLLSSVPQRDT
jgi:hypothetical protein